MSKQKPKPPNKPAANESAARHATPDGMLLELVVVARALADASDADPKAHTKRRDVYLVERDPRDSSARACFLTHTDCPLPTVRRVMLWAEMLRVPIVFDPPGNMEPNWQWPAEAPAHKPEPDDALDF